MVRTELYINGANGTDGYLSFPFGVNIPVSINFNLADVRNPEQRKASRSQTINLFGTNEVNKLFENLFEVNVVTQYFNKNLKTPVRYLVDGLENFAGDMQLIRINIKPDNSIVYECSIIGEGGSLFVDIGEKLIVGNPLTVATSGLLFVGREYTIKDYISGDNFSNVATVISGTINTDGCIFIATGTTPSVWANESILTSLEDLDFSDYDHNYTMANQIGSRTTYLGTGTGYAYPFVDRGTNGGSDTVFNVKDFLPCFSIYEYIKKIIENTGRTFTSTFLESSFFKHLYCYPNLTKLDLTEEQLALQQFYVGLTANINLNANPININGNIFPNSLNNETLPFFDTGGQITTSSIIINESGFYNLVAAIKFKFNFGLFSFGKGLAIEISINNAGTVLNNVSDSLSYPQTLNTDIFKSTSVATGEIFLTAGTSLNVSYSIFKTGSAGGLALNSREILSGINGSSFYALVNKKEVIEGNLLLANNALPTKIKQKEFLTSIFKAFNLFVEPNPDNENDLIIEPFDEFYNTTPIIDYENRTDLAKDQTINPNLLEGKRYIYSYKEDKDYYNDLYKKTYNEVFGTEQIDVDNDFIKSDKKTELIFSATPLIANYGLGIAQPRIYTLDGTNKKTIAANIRLIYCDVKTSPNPYTYKQSGLTDLVTTEYLHGGMEDDAMNPTVSLMFGPAKEFYYSYINAYFTNNTLYNAYHKQYIANLIDRDGKFVTKFLWLNPKDINQFSFRNRLFIDGSYYIVNKIENYTPLDQTSTKVELIKLLETVAFTPEQFLISDSPINAGDGVATARLNSSLNIGSNIQNRGTNCLAVGENIVIPESCSNLIVFGENITVPEDSNNDTFGILKSYEVTASAEIETTSSTYVVATGMILQPTAGKYKIDFNAHYLSIPGNVVGIATLELQTLYLYLANLTATATHGLSFGSGETLTAGVYTVAGAMSVGGVLTLSGGANDLFVFRSNGAINTASSTTIQLTGGVKSSNVFFLANGAVGIGAANTISGTFIAYGAAAALGANAIFSGRLFSTAGAIAFGAGTISKPIDASVVYMGILENFLAFTNSGGVQNTAQAIITGDIGTGTSVVSIFATSVFNGTAYDSTQPYGGTNYFSLFKGSVQIANTERVRKDNNYLEDIALLGVTTTDGKETISVKWRTDVGKTFLKNRILTIVKIQ